MGTSWSASRFYWSLLEASGPVGAGPVPPGLLEALEGDLPEALEALQAVCTPTVDGRVLVCAAQRSELAALDPGITRLCPDHIPFEIAADPGSLNLLVGAFEPRALRRARVRRGQLAIAAVLICAALLMTGLMRRARHWQDQAAQARAACATIVTGAGVASGQGLAEALARAQRESAGRIEPPPDASLALVSILSSWPGAVPSKPSSLRIADKTASIAVSVEGDATAFLGAFHPPVGWTLDEPRVNTAGSLTRLTLLLRREVRP